MSTMPARNPDLHGSAPDHALVALVLIDVINDLEFPGGAKLLSPALKAARCILFVPRDCLASETTAADRYAIEQMERFLKTDTRAWRRIFFEELRGAADRSKSESTARK